jgi:hypothetical protein
VSTEGSGLPTATKEIVNSLIEENKNVSSLIEVPDTSISTKKIREEEPMDEMEASAHPDRERANLEDLKTVEPAIIRSQKNM